MGLSASSLIVPFSVILMVVFTKRVMALVVCGHFSERCFNAFVTPFSTCRIYLS